MNDAIKKATEYCLNCRVKPCSIKGCPLNNNIPAFIKLVKEENLKEAYKVLSETTVLPAICGRICPHEKQCQGSCIRGIKGEPVNIGEIEAYIADEALKNKNSLKEAWQEKVENNEQAKRVAVIGSGPSGLTCAAFLKKYGFDVTIFEKYNSLGGILRRGIPEFRLSKEVLDKTIEQILNLGIKVKFGMELGKNISLNNLLKEYDAIYLAIGANVPTEMKIQGEELNGVYGANTLLEIGNHPSYIGKNVAIIGGGNVAMDAARTALRLGAEVHIVYRRSEAELPARAEEVHHAKEEGIIFDLLCNPTEILADENGWVKGMKCVHMELGEPDASGSCLLYTSDAADEL